MRPSFAALAALVAACGGGEATPDAGPPDAGAPIADAAPAVADAAPMADARPLAACQTAAASTAAVPLADRATVESTLALPAAGDGKVHGLVVAVRLVHPYPRDLELSLISPSGTVVLLSRHRGAAGGYLDTIFDDAAGESIAAASSPFTGAYRPEQPLGALRGEPLAGAWRLRVVDAAAGDSGRLEAWSLVGDGCAPPVCAASTLTMTRDQPSFVVRSATFYKVELDAYFRVSAARVGVDVRYPFDEDLRVALWSPAGTHVALSTNRGGIGGDYQQTFFDDLAAVSIRDAAPPFSGRFRPEQPLALVAGEPAAGSWVVEIAGASEFLDYRASMLELDLCALACPAGTTPLSLKAGAAPDAVEVTAAGTVAAAAVRLSAIGPGPLRVTLRPPAGDAVTLAESAAPFGSALFVDAAAAGALGDAPFAAVRPATPLAALAGLRAAGGWTVAAAGAGGGPAQVGDLELYLCLAP